MANWCYNQVEFSGDEKDLKQVSLLFLAMSKEQEETGEGTKPEFFKEDPDRWFFHVQIDELEPCSIRYDTKWNTNEADLMSIADHFNVTFKYHYEELGCQLFGKYSYQNEGLDHKFLDEEDFARFDWSGDETLFDGEPCESEAEQLETLLNEK